MLSDVSTTFVKNAHWTITKNQRDVTYVPYRLMVFSILPKNLLQEWVGLQMAKTFKMTQTTVIKFGSSILPNKNVFH